MSPSDLAKSKFVDTAYFKTGFYIFSVLLVFLIILCVIAIKKTQKGIRPAIAVQLVQDAKEPSAADELLKYKDLLDKGILTQEEFDAKKKELLGL